jgi:hypothetical protein
MSTKYTAEIYVLEHIWEERTVEVEADTKKEAREKIESYDEDVEIISAEMGELEDTNQEINIESIAETASEQ